MSKKDAAIYRKAAQMIERGDAAYCCFAISFVKISQERINELTERFIKAYGKKNAPCYGWYGNPFDWDDEAREHRQSSRVIALCFAAALADAGDL